MPKLLLSSTFLVPIGFLADSRLDALVIYSFSFVTCLSFLGHKEWRFIIYVVPLLNIAAARGARTLSVSLASYVGIFLMPLNIQRLTAQGKSIWEALFRGVSLDAFRKFWVHPFLRPHSYEKLPRGRLPCSIQRLLQKH